MSYNSLDRASRANLPEELVNADPDLCQALPPGRG